MGTGTAQCSEIDLGWALGAVKHAYLAAAEKVLVGAPGGLRGYLVLVTTGRGEPKSQLALAQHLGVDRTVMTYLLDDLEQAGLVARRPDPADRRARRVVMTEAGRARLAELKEGLYRAEDEFLAPLGEQDRAMFRALLQRLARAVGPADPCEVMQVAMRSEGVKPPAASAPASRSRSGRGRTGPRPPAGGTSGAGGGQRA